MKIWARTGRLFTVSAPLARHQGRDRDGAGRSRTIVVRLTVLLHYHLRFAPADSTSAANPVMSARIRFIVVALPLSREDSLAPLIARVRSAPLERLQRPYGT